MKRLLSILLLCALPCAPVVAETKTVNFIQPVPVPSSITIAPGDSIRFNGVSTFHPIRQVTDATGDTPFPGGFSSTDPGFTHRFDEAGTYFYQCTNHGTFGGSMRGVVIVQAGANPTPTTGPDATPEPTVAPPDGCTTKPAASVLTAPANKTVSNKTRVTLDWEDNACASDYRVSVRAGKKKGPVADQKTVTKSTYKTKKLEKKKTYFWTLKSCNSFGCTNSPARSFSIP